jgi:hypothetical protein
MLPTFIRSAREFDTTIELKVTPESVVLDFKETLDNWNTPKQVPGWEGLRREGQKNLCRNIAQFANTFGGTLVIGVDEDKKNAPNIARAIAPVEKPEEMRDWITQAVLNFVVPSTLSLEICEIKLAEGTVLAVNVPAHADLVAVYDRDTHAIEYIRRHDNRKAHMNPDEAERHRMNGGRAARIRLIEAMQGHAEPDVDLAGVIINRLIHSGYSQIAQAPVLAISVRLVNDAEDVFELVMTIRDHHGRPTIRIPFSAIDSVWLDGPKRVGMILRFPIGYNGARLFFDAHPPPR